MVNEEKLTMTEEEHREEIKAIDRKNDEDKTQLVQVINNLKDDM